MKFKTAVLPVAVGALLSAFAASASAAECGAAGGQPCKTDHIAPKPVSTERIGKTSPSNSAPLPAPPKRAAPPAPEKATVGTSKKPAAEPQGAIDVKLSAIPDIIVPEPKGDAQHRAPAAEPEAEVGIAPMSPSDAARLHRDDPMP